MGAKLQSNVKKRRATCKCDICGRGFLNVQALRTHHSFAHPKSRQRVAYKPNTEVLAARGLLTKSTKESTMQGEQKVAELIKDDDDDGEPTRLEFECPICNKVFNAVFHAHKHIQKSHKENSKEGSPNSSDSVKPIRKEMCLACNLQVIGNHICAAKDNYIEQSNYGLKCLGCQKNFYRTMLFDLHISGIHSNELLTLFFPTLSEFNAWKKHTKSQMQCSYLKIYDLPASDKSPKTIYRCPFYMPNLEINTTGFCPSSIVVQTFPKGYQVHFYKKHYGHMPKPYKLADLYKKYSISYQMLSKDLLSSKSYPEKVPEKYYDFKKMMLSIILDAQHVDTDCFKKIYEKAIDMSDILNESNEHSVYSSDKGNKKSGKKADENLVDDTSGKILASKNLTDEEISLAVNDVPASSKRKQDSEETPNDDNEVNKKRKDVRVRSPVDFNDSFKKFVGSMNNKTDSPKEKKKEIVKTKIGQFKPSPMKKKVKSPDIKNELKVNTPETKEVKTYSKVKKLEFDLSKVKSEKYEVMEQENDCNILILKI